MRVRQPLCIIALTLLPAVVTAAQSRTGTLTPGEVVRSHMQLDGPGVEIWRFVGEAGQVVSVTARSTVFEPAMHVVSPTGEELARDDEGVLNDRGREDAQLAVVLPVDGEYLVRVAAEGPTRGGAYQLALRTPTVMPIELNLPADGHYDESRGHDVWGFEGRAGQIVCVTVRADGFTPMVGLTSPRSKQLARSGNYVVPRRPAQLLVLLPVDGRYFVDVHDAFLFESGPYEIAVHPLTPAPLEMNAEVRGVLGVEGAGADVWSFDAAPGQAVRVLVRSDAFDAGVDVISPAGEILGGRARVVPLAAWGRYLVGVVNRGDSGLRGPGGRYAVSVRPVAVASLAADEPVVGLLVDRSTDVDVWGFEGVAGQAVSVQADSDEHESLQVVLVSPTGEQLADDYRHHGASPRFVASLPVDGRYLVRLEAVGPPEPRPYALEVRVLRETPTLVELDAPATGRFDGAGPKVGFWEFEGNAGQLVSVATHSAAFYTSIELVSPSGAVISTSVRSRRARVTELLAVSGRYSVRVMAADESVGRYEIRVGSTGVSPRPIERNGLAVVDERDVQLWSFEGEAGEVVRLTAIGPFMAFDVMSPAGEVIAMNEHRMAVRLPLDGRYLVRVQAVRGDGAPRYAMAASAVAAPTRTPPTLSMNELASGELHQLASGTDVWAFEGSEGQVVAIAVDGFYGPVVQLLSPAGEELAWAYSPERDVRLETRLPATGRYLVRVLVHTDFWTWPNSLDYQIALRPVQGPAPR